MYLDRDKFHDSFAGDLPADEAAFMADSQVSAPPSMARVANHRGAEGIGT